MSGKFALIIGTTEYQDASFPRLKTPTMDVLKLADVLQSKEIGGFDDVRPLINEGESTIRRTLVTFFENRSSDDLLLLYFSGHGVIQERTNRLFLAVRDTEKNLLGATAIASSFISEQMDNCASKQLVLILDCCHSGAIAQGAKGEVGGSVGTSSAFQGMGTGRVILTASDATQNAYEGANSSIFTQYLVQGLESGEADRDRDGAVSLEEWYHYAHDQVISQKSGQTPAMFSFQKGTIVIARNPNPVQVKQELPEDIRKLLDDVAPISRVQAIMLLRSLLYGNNPGLAAAAEEALDWRANNDVDMFVINNAKTVLDEYSRKMKRSVPQPEPPPQVVTPKPPVIEVAKTPPPEVTPPPVVPPQPLTGALPRKLAELNQIIEILGSSRINLVAVRDQLSQWRSETAIAIRNERGIQAALMFGAINAPRTLSGDLQRLRSIAEQCRQYLFNYLRQ